MCYSVSIGEFMLHVGYSGVLIGNHGELVGFSGTCDLSISLVVVIMLL
jgi:hypothetical protein